MKNNVRAAVKPIQSITDLGKKSNILTVPRPLRTTLGEEASDALIELMNKANKRQTEDILVFVEEKFERRLAEEISKVNERITKEVQWY